MNDLSKIFTLIVVLILADFFLLSESNIISYSASSDGFNEAAILSKVLAIVSSAGSIWLLFKKKITKNLKWFILVFLLLHILFYTYNYYWTTWRILP